MRIEGAAARFVALPATAVRPGGVLAGLPTPVADRLAGFLAADPELADAVIRRLPEARIELARDLASGLPGRSGDRRGLAAAG